MAAPQVANLTATGLPTGTVTVTASAFDATCSQVTSQTPLTWVSDAAVQVQMGAGSVTPISIVLRPAGGVTVTATFSDDVDGGTPVNLPPTVATMASASPSTVTGTTTVLSVLGADDGGEANLTYTWASVGAAPATVSFSANGTNGAKTATATFAAAGSYTFQVTIKDQGNLSIVSSVSVTVNPTLTNVVVTPASATVLTSATRQFTATARDQFSTDMPSQPTFTWMVNGGGAVSATGLFTAGTSVGGPYTVQAASGGIHGVATVTIGSAPAPTAIYRIDVGSSSAVSPFAADSYGSGGTRYSVTSTISTTGVANAAPAAVYQTERYGNSTYTLPDLVPSTQYTVRLHFAELYQTATGKRVFNVLINDTTVLSGFDVFAAAGARYKAVVRDFTATPNASGQIVIKFNTVTDNATIGGIEVLTSQCGAGQQYCGSACVYAGTSVAPTGITVAGTTSICSGASRVLTVSGGSLGTGASWVWYTNSSHTGPIGTGALITVSPSATTTYYVRAEGPCSNTADASQTLSLTPPPQFATNPQDHVVPCNSTASVNFTATPSSGTTVSSIQWYVLCDYAGCTQTPAPEGRYYAGVNTLTLTAVPDFTKSFWCTITDECGRTAWSSPARMTVPDPSTCVDCSAGSGLSTAPTGITLSGESQVCPGASRVLSVTGGSLGTGASWVWYTNSSHTASIGTGASITVSPTATTTYYVRAEGPCNTTQDALKTLSIAPPPQFAQDPQDFAVPCNSTASVNFRATPSSGTTVSSIQWYVLCDYEGCTQTPAPEGRYYAGVNTLTLTAVPDFTKSFWCTITDECGRTAWSSPARMTVPDPSTCVDCSAASGLSTAPTGITLSGESQVCPGASKVLSVTGGSLGTGASWVWYTDSSHTASIGTGASITVSPTATTTYYVRAEGPCNTTQDALKTLSIAPPPQFAQDPQSFAVPCNSTASVHFTATPSSGTTVSSIQWYVLCDYEGCTQTPAPEGRYYAGVNTLTLTAIPDFTKSFWCTITDECGRTAWSSQAWMTVPDPSTCP